MVATTAPKNTAIAPRAFPVSTAARQLSLSESHCWNLIKKGEIRVIRIGRRTLITAAELSRLLGEAPDAASSPAFSAA